jgi:hypothetical protein
MLATNHGRKSRGSQKPNTKPNVKDAAAWRGDVFLIMTGEEDLLFSFAATHRSDHAIQPSDIVNVFNKTAFETN